MAKPVTLLDVEACERHAADGLAEYQIAALLGVSQDTFTKRKRDQPGLADALTRGRQSAVGKMENAAYTCARSAVGDPRYQASMIFWLKANAGWKERTVVETVSTDDAGDSRDTLLARVHALARRVGGEPPDARA